MSRLRGRGEDLRLDIFAIPTMGKPKIRYVVGIIGERKGRCALPGNQRWKRR